MAKARGKRKRDLLSTLRPESQLSRVGRGDEEPGRMLGRWVAVLEEPLAVVGDFAGPWMLI